MSPGITLHFSQMANDSNGRRPFRPRLKRPIIKFDDWTFEPRPKWPTAIWGGPKWPSATLDWRPFETFTT